MKNNLDALLNKLELHLSNHEALHLPVSKSTIGWHIEHTLLTINGVVGAIQKSNPKEYIWKFSLIKIIILTTKKIPRGNAKAPKVVVPNSTFDRDELQQHLTTTRNKIKALELVSKDNYFEHPFFGKLKLKQAIRFLEIHTTHHLNIISDIVQQ